ncbi:glycine zipper 2TM domain-containing protein [Synechococcus sp. KORDI-52]|uniref:glycine zipper 2TM domain-containing protein n=1 Tax=Synechococcus sp. KORDI-52 TaxID=585425 RepID=UPI0035280704
MHISASRSVQSNLVKPSCGSMKKTVVALLPGVLLTSLLQGPVLAHKDYSQAKTCYQNEYVEKYHPGTREKPGYVSSREEKVQRPCPKNLHFHGQTSHKHQQGNLAHDHHSHSTMTTGARADVRESVQEDNNSCLEGSLAGGVLGGALGGVLAKKDNWIWSIPAGAVGGALVGCQVDGG